MSLFKDVCFRRPALQRQSALLPLHKALDDYIHRLFIHELDQYIVMIETFGEQFAPYTTNMFAFDLQKELHKVRKIANSLFDVLYDYTWDHIASGKASDDILRDRRVQEILCGTVMGLPIKMWLEWTLEELYIHFVKESKNWIPNNLLRYAMEDTLKSLLRRCPTFLLQADTLSEFMQKVLKKIPGNTMLYNELHKIVYGISSIDPDVLYLQVRQLLILPPTLVACIREELVCQEALDMLEYKMHKRRTEKRMRSSIQRRNSSHRRNSSQSKQYDAIDAARKALEEAESLTAQLVKWYDVSEDVAKKRLAYQKTLVGKQSFIQQTGRTIRRWLQKPAYTTTQRKAQRKLKAALDVQAKRDPSRVLLHRHARTHTVEPVSLFDCSLLKILYATLSPFHIYHKKWTGQASFVALTHHLHMLNLLPVLAIYIPKSSTDFRYVRHVKGVPFTDKDTRKNQQECMKDAKENRDAWCNLALAMDDPAYPRELLLKEKHCLNREMLLRAKKQTAKMYRRIQREARLSEK